MTSEYPCAGCGARVEYAPGTTALRCPYCGFEQQLATPDRTVREHAIDELATLPRKPLATLAAHTLVCRKCGAQTQSDAIADRCQFCAAPLVADVTSGEQIAPEAVLPFAVDRGAVREALGKWARSRWFAPGSLKKVTDAESTRGTYLPHWTFDAKTVSDYDGQRGEHYYETETYTENGETRTREVQRTRWYPASGTVSRDFDDVLVTGTGKVTTRHLEKLEPWPLAQAVPYQPDYLAGYTALRYDVEPESGLETAKARMAKVIENDCERDIGGDEQRLNWIRTRYFELMYKLVLLPVWIASYLHGGKTFTVLVNGRTGEVIGQRPYSRLKIVIAVLAGIVLAAVIIWLIVVLGHGHGPRRR